MALLGPDTALDVALTVYRYFSDPTMPLAATLDLLRESTVCVRFAIVELSRDASNHATIALRGDVSVDLGSAATSRFTWPEGATWVSADADDLEVVRLSLGAAPQADPTLPFSTGVVKASDLVVSLDSVNIASADATPWTVGPADDADGDDHELTVLLEETVARTAHRQRQANMEPFAGGSSRVDSSPAASIAPMPIAPLAAPPESASPSSPMPGPASSTSPAAPPPRHPQRVDLSSLMRPVTWTLRLPDGNELEAGSSIVVGRRPWRSDPDETSTYYIVAPSPLREISSKHLEFSVVGDALVARDLESTNGTLILAPNKPPRLLTDGRTVTLDSGDTLDLGEGFQIVVGERR